jgi:hypothetical protein
MPDWLKINDRTKDGPSQREVRALANTLLRFVTVRPPQREGEEDQPPTVETHPSASVGATASTGGTGIGMTGPSQTELLRALMRAREREDRATMRRIGQDFVASGRFVKGFDTLHMPFDRMDRWLFEHNDSPPLMQFERVIGSYLGGSISSAIDTDEYREDRLRIGDSLLSIYIGNDFRVVQTPRPYLARAMRIFGLLETDVRNREELDAPGGIARTLRARVRLPEALYPLPSDRVSTPAAGDSSVNEEGGRKELRDAIDRLGVLGDAIEELAAKYEADRLERADDVAPRGSASVQQHATDVQRTTAAPVGRQRASALPVALTSATEVPFLSPVRQGELTDGTRRVLEDVGIPIGAIRVPAAVARLEERAAGLSRRIHMAGRPEGTIRLGTELVNVENVVGTDADLILDHKDGLLPRVCSPTAPSRADQPIVSEVPASPGQVLSASIGDLMVVEQEIQRYDPGEVAHIENVLMGESKQRTHRTKQTVEEAVIIETEVSRETERDLQSTERFELQTEMQEVVRDDTAREAGITVSGSYGQVHFQADARYSRETAREESERTGTTYARDVTERAVSRVQERVREERTRRTTLEIEETSLHGLENAGGDANIVGVYRWIDKVYKAQLVNYGRRAMFEFVIPEPGAFLKFAASSRPIEGLDLTRPQAPGFCSTDGTFIPLQPQDISEFGPFAYLYWVGRYNANDVNAPPPRYKIVGTGFGEKTPDEPNAKVETTVQAPPGYLARRAWLSGNRAATASDATFLVYVGRHAASNFNFVVALDGEDAVIPISVLTAGVSAYAFNVEIECERSVGAYEDWQQSVFSAVMTAYLEALAEYSDRVAALRVQQEPGELGGRNPAVSRQLEQTELKRAAISILTGQHFDSFDALRLTADPHGYPQLDLPETALEAPFIRFFEQAFEWENMVYVFYPYYWGRKDDWVRDAMLEDADLVFGEFLRAGAARLVVPARPGFEEAVAAYLEHGWPIVDEADPAAGAPETDDLPLLSIVDEVKSQQGYSATPGVGVLAVVQGSPDVDGTDTDFDPERDSDREIHIDGVKYRIASVSSPTNISLTEPYAGANASELAYSLGVRYIGEPWEVRVPTTLVRLEANPALPVFS